MIILGRVLVWLTILTLAADVVWGVVAAIWIGLR